MILPLMSKDLFDLLPLFLSQQLSCQLPQHHVQLLAGFHTVLDFESLIFQMHPP